jgi:hypothetical protein
LTLMTASLALTSPLDNQVVQRRSPREGLIPVAGGREPSCGRVAVRISSEAMNGPRHAAPWLTAMGDDDRGPDPSHSETFKS